MPPSLEELHARLTALEARLAADDAPPGEMPPINPKTLYEVKHVARRLRCGDKNVYLLIHSGKLAALRVGPTGKGYRVLGSDLIAFIEANKEGGPGPEMTYKHLNLR